MLTKKQLDLLLFIDNHIKKTGFSPSFEEMKEALELKSKSGIHSLLSALIERGFVEKLPNKARALEVIKLPDMNAMSNSSKIVRESPAPQPQPQAINHSSSSGEEMIEVPLHGKIAAGTPIDAIRNEQDMISLPMSMLGGKKCYALTVEGDSMIKAGIMDGDIVIIEHCDSAHNGDIVVALVDEEEVTLKRLRREIGSIVLMPENDSYQPIRLEPRRVRVQGKLKSLIRYY